MTTGAEGVLRPMGGAGSVDTVTITCDGSQTARIYQCVWLPDECIEQIAEAVVKKLSGTMTPRDRDIAVGKDCRDCVEWDTCPCGKEGHEKGTSMGYSSGECKWYCDRNICKTNELNGVGCDECVIAQNYNLEDDDSPCQNCEVGE